MTGREFQQSEPLQHAIDAFAFGLCLADAAAEGGVPPTILEAALRELLATHARLSPTTHRKLLSFVTTSLSKNLGASQVTP